MSCETTSSATQLTQEIKSVFSSVPLLKMVLDPNAPTSSISSSFNVSTSSLEYTSSEECVCTTENGAKSYDSTNDPRLDLFFKTVRGMTPEYLFHLLEKSWDVSPRDTLRTMFYVRDCRGGKGEKKIFFDFMVWLWTNHRSFFEKNIPCIPFYGCFKDLKKIIESVEKYYSDRGLHVGTSLKNQIVSYWCDVLAKDVEAMNRNENITLAAKWVSIQDGSFCKQMKLTHKLFRKMVRLLRDKLDIVECKMSSGEWDKIYFERVCSVSMKRYNKAFQRHCEQRFSEYLESVKKGEKKMNVGQLYPSDIAGPYLKSSTLDETSEVAWEQLLTKCRSTLGKTNKKFMCVVDTSGSMEGKPLEVAVSLGLFLSELYPESKFFRNFVTFSATPRLQKVEGDSLYERVKSIQTSDWSMNTNLQKVFTLLLEESTPEDHPDVVLILSDMQFDSAFVCQNNVDYLAWGSGNEPDMRDESSTNLEEIERKYKEKGISRPRLIFWNLRSNTVDFPSTTSVSDCGLVSGYSPSIIDGLLEEGDISPMSLFRKTIDNSRYDLVFDNCSS